MSETFLCAHPANLTIVNLYTDKKEKLFHSSIITYTY